MAGPTNTRNNNTGGPESVFNIRPVNNAHLVTQPSPNTFSQITESPISLTSNPQQSGGGPNGIFQIESDATRQQTINIFTETNPGASIPLSPVSIPQNVSGRLNIVEAMQGVSSQPPRAPNSSVGMTPNPIRILTSNDLGEDTYGLPQDVVNAGSEPVANLPSSLRPDIVACTKVNTAYALRASSQANKTSAILAYMDDLYKLSLAQDTLRRTLLANRLATESASNQSDLQNALQEIGDNVATDMSDARQQLALLESLVTKTVRIKEAFSVKRMLGSDPANPNLVFRAPLTDLRDFAITRMLYSPVTFDKVSDTKLLYQLISDASNVLKKCSFALVDGFVDYDRSQITAVSEGSLRNNIDSETYGNNAFSYVPALITAKYFLNAQGNTASTVGNTDYSAFTSSLPGDPVSRTKFLFWLISKELRVSKGLGKYLPEDAAQVFGGIANIGNPFDNIFGAVPSNIYSVPAGLATISGLFNVASTTENSSTNRSQRILPFENSNIDLVSYANDSAAVNNVISGESVFIAQHLAGSPTLLRNYRSLYTSRVQAANAIIDRLLLSQQSYDPTSDVLTPDGLSALLLAKLRAVLGNLSATSTMSPVNAVLSHMFLAAQSSPQFRFELFKLLCLCYLYGTIEGDSTRFRTILFQELSASPLSGGETATVLTTDNLPGLAATQLTTVLTMYRASLRAPASLTGFALQYDLTATTFAQTTFTEASIQNILYSAQPVADANPFLAVVSVVKDLFSACASSDGAQYQLVPNSSITRYSGLSSSGMMLVMFEIISGLLIDYLGAGTANVMDDDLIQVSYSQDTATYNVGVNPASITALVATNGIAATKMTDLKNAVLGEEHFIANALGYLRRLGTGMESISNPSPEELAAISYVNALGGTNAKLTFASLRTARNNYRIASNKLARNNPNNQRLLNFYVDADNPDLGSVDYAVLRDFTRTKLLATTNDQPVRTILSVGIPKGFLDTVSDTDKDIVLVRVHRLNSRREDMIYQPVEFVFDMSLFPDSYRSRTDPYVSCVDINESGTLSNISGASIADLVRVEPFYANKESLARACMRNITNSYLLRSYINMVTGINVDDSSMRDIGSVAVKLQSGFQTLSSDGLAQPQAVLKDIQPRTYEGYLSVFQTFYGDSMAQNLLLPLTRNISDFVFGSRLYDRVFNVAVAPSDFAIDEAAMQGNNRSIGRNALLLNNAQYRLTNPNTGVVIDQYYVEIVAR